MVGNKGAKEEMGKRRESERSADFPRGRYREPFTWYELLAPPPNLPFSPAVGHTQIGHLQKSIDLEILEKYEIIKSESFRKIYFFPCFIF